MTTITFQESLNLETKSFNSISDFLGRIDFNILKEKYKERKIKENITKKDKFIKENYDKIVSDLEEGEKEETIDINISQKMLLDNLRKYTKV